MKTLIKGAKLVDPGNIVGHKDILINGDSIEAILNPGECKPLKTFKIIDATKMFIVPGLIDIHVHLREPGHEYKETIESGVKAAVKGGFTSIVSMPNTNPVNDNSQVTKFILNRAKEVKLAKVYPSGAITKDLKGESLSEIYDMKQAGIVAVTDDGRPVEDSNMMRRALEYCKGIDMSVFVHAEDLSIGDKGSMNEGKFSTRFGIKGIPNTSESIMVERDIALARVIKTHVHFCHISTKESVKAIRKAKKEGVNISCETAAHYFTLTDGDIKDYSSNFKMNPPLRSADDKKAIIEGLCDGTIDLIASDHAPHSMIEKDVEFDKAAFGIIGLETSLPVSLNLVHNKFLTFEDIIIKMSKNPAKILGIDNDIKPGNKADITIINPECEYEIDPEKFESKSRNTPFKNFKAKGSVFLTMVDGRIVFEGSNLY